jgi:hypothetical protein
VPFRLETRLWLPARVDRVFAFFADRQERLREIFSGDAHEPVRVVIQRKL